MAIQSLVFLLSLAVTVQSWPQLQSAESGIGKSIPFAPRSLPSVEEIESMGTLHIPVSRRELPKGDELDETAFTLPVGLRRGLPTGDDSPGTLTLPVIHAPKPGLVGRNLEVQLENRSDVAYYAQLYVGTPAQPIYAQLDTGSFELWVNPDCSSLSSSADKHFCSAVGEYSPDDSSTSRPTGESKTLNYGLGKADVTYYADNVGLSKDAKLKNIQFGVAEEGGTEDQFAGVLGLGYGEGVNTKYMNVLDEMAEQDIVATKAFSVALGSKDEGGGVIVFGGVDTSKFNGELAGLPIISAEDAPDRVARYWVQMDSISHSAPGSSKTEKWDGTDMPVFLDTGATLTLLPPKVVEAIATDFGSDGKDDAGFYAVDCALVDKPGTVDFAFDGVTVKVPYNEVIRHFQSGGSQSCYLGISPSEEFTLLGDTFLRSAYVVFDLESDTVFMAQYENCGSSVSNIKDSSDLKDLKGSCGGSQASEEDGSEDDDEGMAEAVSSAAPQKETSTATSEGLPEMTEVTTSSVGTEASATTVSKPEETQPSESGPDESQGGDDAAADTGGESGDDNAAARLEGWLGVTVGCIAVMAMR